MLEVVLLLLAVLFAMNIGASGAAATMAQVYGGGALRQRQALALVAVFVVIGAVLAGKAVVHTIGEGIVNSGGLSVEVAMVVLLAALIPLFIANLIGIPLSTSEVTVGALIGVGLALGGLHLGRVGFIVLSWALLPVLAFAISAAAHYLAGHPLEHFLEERQWPWLRRLLSVLLILGGSFAAFSAGANNAANAVGPLVGAGVLSVPWALVVGGLFMGVGALVLGGRVLETNGRRITRLTLPAGITVDFTSASLVLGMSLMGMPVPLTQATTGAILGVGFAHRGTGALRQEVVKKVASVWLLSPAAAMVIAFFLLNFLRGLEGDFQALVIVTVVSSMLILGGVLLRKGARGVVQGWARLGSVVASMGVHHGARRGHPERVEQEAASTLHRHRHEESVEAD